MQNQNRRMNGLQVLTGNSQQMPRGHSQQMPRGNSQQMPTGNSLIIYGDGLILGGGSYPAADLQLAGLQMQPAPPPQEQRLQPQHLRHLPQEQPVNARAPGRQSQRIQQQPPFMQQQQQQQQQRLQPYNPYGNQQFSGMNPVQPNFNGGGTCNVHNGYKPVTGPQAEVYNYGNMPLKGYLGMWPGYTQLPPVDPSKPFGFGFGAAD